MVKENTIQMKDYAIPNFKLILSPKLGVNLPI